MDDRYLSREPVRLYGRIFATASALLALAAFYVPDLPVAALLAVVSAALGLGVTEIQRGRVTPVVDETTNTAPPVVDESVNTLP